MRMLTILKSGSVSALVLVPVVILFLSAGHLAQPPADPTQRSKYEAAEKLFAEAEKLTEQGTAQYRRKAIEKFLASQKLFDEVGGVEEAAKTIPVLFTLVSQSFSFSTTDDLKNILLVAEYWRNNDLAKIDRQFSGYFSWMQGEAEFRLGDKPNSFLSFQKAALDLRAADAVLYDPLALSLSRIAELSRERGDRSVAIRELESIVKDFYRLTNVNFQINVLAFLAKEYEGIGLFDEAVQSHRMALAIYTRNGEHEQAAYVSMRIGEFYERQGLFGDAFEAYKRSNGYFWEKARNP